MKERLKIVEVSLYVVIVRSDRADRGPADGREVLTSILAATRALGQIGVLANGDFVICMPSANEDAVLQRAYAIRDRVERFSDPNATDSATVSIGLSLVRHADSFEEMLAAASAAVEESADHGGNRVVISQAVPAS